MAAVAVGRVLAGVLALAGVSAAAFGTFSRGYDGRMCVGQPVTVLSHTVADPKSTGVMDHWWSTGASEEDQAAAGVKFRVEYAFDGEATPSISLNPMSASGQWFGAVRLGNASEWADGTRRATQGNSSMWSAGDKMGKNALTGGLFNYFKLPFQRSVVVTASFVPRADGPAPAPSTCLHLYCVVRGHEAPAAGPSVVLPTGFALPPGARMELQRTDVVAAPNAFVPLANVSAGREGLLFAVSLGLTASPAWGSAASGKLETTNNYVEGCWHLMRTINESLPGQVLGTGLEDFFDSAYGFSIVAPGFYPQPPGLYPGAGVVEVQGAPFQHPSSGVLHFSADYTAPGGPVERFSAYRFFDAETVGFDDGGQFGWDNGCGYTGPDTNKCGERPLRTAAFGSPLPPPSPPLPPPRRTSGGACKTYPTRVRANVWLYTWPKP